MLGDIPNSTSDYACHGILYDRAAKTRGKVPKQQRNTEDTIQRGTTGGADTIIAGLSPNRFGLD